MEGSEAPIGLVKNSQSQTLDRLDALESFIWSWPLWAFIGAVLVVVLIWSHLPVTRRQRGLATITLPPAVSTLCADLLSRTQRLRGWAATSLVVAFVVLMVGGYFIVFLAPGLAVRDELVRQRSTVAFEAARLKKEIEDQLGPEGASAWYQMPAAGDVYEFVFFSDDLSDITVVLTDGSLARSRDGGRTWAQVYKKLDFSTRNSFRSRARRFQYSANGEILDFWVDIDAEIVLVYARQTGRLLGLDLSKATVGSTYARPLAALNSDRALHILFKSYRSAGPAVDVYVSTMTLDVIAGRVAAIDKTSKKSSFEEWNLSGAKRADVGDLLELGDARCRGNWCAADAAILSGGGPRSSLFAHLDDAGTVHFEVSPPAGELMKLGDGARLAGAIMLDDTLVSLYDNKDDTIVIVRKPPWKLADYLAENIPSPINSSIYDDDLFAFSRGNTIYIMNSSEQVFEIDSRDSSLSGRVQTYEDVVGTEKGLTGPFWSMRTDSDRVYFVEDGTSIVSLDRHGTVVRIDPPISTHDTKAATDGAELDRFRAVSASGAGGYRLAGDTGVFFDVARGKTDFLAIDALSDSISQRFEGLRGSPVTVAQSEGLERRAQFISMGDGGAFVRGLYSTDLSAAKTVQDLLQALRTILPPEISARYVQEARTLEAAIKDATRVTLLEDDSDDFEERLLTFVGHETLPRIIVLVVTFFIVQLLIRMFQYNTRLASFHEARADAMLAVAGYGLSVSPGEFSHLVSVLSPDLLDFGKAPKTQLHEAAELTKALLTRADARST